MTLTTSPLGLLFTVSGVSYQTDIDSTLNILRRREEILYRSISGDKIVNLAYFASKELNSLTTLSIDDRSTSLIANRIATEGFTVIEDSSSHSLETDKFLVTDVFAAALNTLNDTPLFFKHRISDTFIPRVSSSDDTIKSGTTLISATVLDRNYQEVVNSELKIDLTEGIIYNNLESSYDSTTGNLTVYYVKYTVDDGTLIKTYTEILDNQNVYKLADFDDLDSSLKLINDGRKVYLIEEENDSFNITLPTTGKYAFKNLTDTRIKIVPPPPSNLGNPWRVSVTEGQFVSFVGNSPYKYKIAEFNDQGWDPFVPIKKITSEESTVISSTLINLNRRNIYQDTSESLYIDLLVSDKDDNPVAAYTTNPSKENNVSSNTKRFVVWDEVNKEGIRGVDHRAGIVDIEGKTLKSSYKITSTYYFEEKSYEVNYIDFNPINNLDILSQRVSFFIYPDDIDSSRDQSLYYLIMNKSGKVIKSNWDKFDNDSASISGVALFYEKKPDYLPNDPHDIFVSKYSVESSGTFLILGDIYLKNETSPKQSTLIDVRTEGGGIKESLVDDILEESPEAAWHWDIGNFDGKPYPSTANYLVEVPVEVLEDAGGTLRTNEVRDIVNRHTAAGIYPLVRAYGVDPTVSGIVPENTAVSFKWRSYGSN